MPKMITIGSVGSAPHIREIYSYQKCLPFFYSSDTLYSPNGRSHLDHIASIHADCLKEVHFGVSRLGKKILGSNLPPKIEKN
jgi:hypothetical protein